MVANFWGDGLRLCVVPSTHPTIVLVSNCSLTGLIAASVFLVHSCLRLLSPDVSGFLATSGFLISMVSSSTPLGSFAMRARAPPYVEQNMVH